MRTEISKSGMMRVYDDQGNERACIQLPAKIAYEHDPLKIKPSEPSIVPYIPLFALLGGLL